jgi:hypothetical protein
LLFPYYAGLRIGLYSPLKHSFTAEGTEANLGIKIAAGMTSGAVAAGVCNPTDLIKTRMQTKGATISSPFAVAATVVREEGVLGLWKGTTPSMVRGTEGSAEPPAVLFFSFFNNLKTKKWTEKFLPLLARIL